VSTLPSVSIVVVNWSGRHLLEDCLPSIAALDYPASLVETIVVDNGSEDGSVEWLGRAWPGVRVLASAENVGFAAASNRGAAAGSGELLAFLNNDLRVAPSWLRHMVEARATTGAAVAGSCVLDWEGRCYDFGGAAMNFHGHGTNRCHGRPYAAARAAAPPSPALFACGAAMLADRARFLSSGGFDPDYFAYFEDVDLGWRLWVQGEQVVYVPAALAYHRHHGSGLAAERRTRLLERNALASLVKNYDDENLARALPAALALLAARARLAGEGARVYRDVLAEHEAARAVLETKRAAVQARRRRADRDIVPLFAEPLRPSFFGQAYWQEQCRVVRAFGIARLLGAEHAGALVEGLDAFVEELEGRVESLERELAGERRARAEALAAHRQEHDRLVAEVERLRREQGTRVGRGFWRALGRSGS